MARIGANNFATGELNHGRFSSIFRKMRARMLVVAGGVAANQGLRERLADDITDAEVVIPPLRLCGDNAGMIALAAAIEYDKGNFAGLDLNAKPSLAFDGMAD